MKPPKKYFNIACIVAVIVSLYLVVPPSAVFAQQWQNPGRNTIRAINESQFVARAEGSRRLKLVIGLSLRHKGELAQLIVELYDPRSPEYRHFLTPYEFKAEFAPTRDQYSKTVNFLLANGYQVVRTSKNRLLIDAQANVATVERTLGVRINYYYDRNQAGKVFYANDRDPVLPAELRDIVESIMGMENHLQLHALNSNLGPDLNYAHYFPWRTHVIPSPTPTASPTPSPTPTPTVTPTPSPTPTPPPTPTPTITPPPTPTPTITSTPPPTPTPTPTPTRTPSPTPTPTPTPTRTPTPTPAPSQTPTPSPTATPLGYSPQQIGTAYDFGATYNGAGVTVAIATAYTYTESDVATFWSTYGITAPSHRPIPVDGTATQTDVETTLDLERVGAMANGANVLVYEGANPEIITFADAYNMIVADNFASVVATSWGLCEPNMPSSYMQLDDEILAQGVVQGQTWFAASGDGGAQDCGTGTLAVDFPGSDPNLGAAGGTTLALNGNGTIATETAWSGSGGGLSIDFTEPSWQLGPGVTNAWSNGMRQGADIAFDADPATGYSVYYNSAWSVFGGTSFAAPNWAAIFALINQARAQNGVGRIGHPGPALYGLNNGLLSQPYPAFHDIVSGSNGYYAATTNWDYPTGWGSVDVANLIRDLMQ